MIQGKAGWWIAGVCAVVILFSIGYGMGRKSGLNASQEFSSLTPAGAPLASIQVEPIQPKEELAAIASTMPPVAGPAAITPTPAATARAAGDPAPGNAATASADPSLQDSGRVREIQQALKTAGFDPGPVDGRMGQRTRTALRDFQTAQGLQPDGKVGPRTWNKLETFLNQSRSSNSSTND